MAATIFVRPVAARANLIAASTASEPELERKTRLSLEGAAARSFSTKRDFAAVPKVGPTWISSLACAAIASATSGWQCPRFATPKFPPQSTYSVPSASQRVAPNPRTNVGSRLGKEANSPFRDAARLR